MSCGAKGFGTWLPLSIADRLSFFTVFGGTNQGMINQLHPAHWETNIRFGNWVMVSKHNKDLGMKLCWNVQLIIYTIRRKFLFWNVVSSSQSSRLQDDEKEKEKEKEKVGK